MGIILVQWLKRQDAKIVRRVISALAMTCELAAMPGDLGICPEKVCSKVHALAFARRVVTVPLLEKQQRPMRVVLNAHWENMAQ
jgi:hypothetical protein